MGSAVSCSKQDAVEGAGMAVVIGNENDFADEEMKEVKVNDAGDTILVGKSQGKFYGFGKICPHYGAPLIKGVLRNGKVRCPWHGACFDVATGDIEEYPGLNCIPSYAVTKIQNGDLTVSVGDVKIQSIMRPLGKGQNSKNCIAIIGGGAAGFMCAVTLRENKYEGRIIIISEDGFLPYDRPKLSKVPGAEWDNIKLKGEDFFITHNIEVLKNSIVERIEFEKHQIYIQNETPPVVYNKLLIASGVRPRTHNVPGSDLKNIETLYLLKDSQEIREKSKGKTIAIIGSSFIAMELASSLKDLAEKIIILSRSALPYGVTLGEAAGTALLNHLLTKASNVSFHSGEEVKLFEGDEDHNVKKVVTLKDSEFEIDMVIVAIGAVPSTKFLENTVLTLSEKDKSIPVSEYMETNIQDVFAAGDVTNFPLKYSASGKASAGHWGVALKHGKVAALNILGIRTSIAEIMPFFWTSVCGVNVRYAGYGANYNESLVFGDPNEMKFCIMYLKEKRTLAVMTVNCDPIAARAAFDIELSTEYKDGQFPSYITDVFPNPPLLVSNEK